MEPRTAHFIYWVTNFALVIAAISLHEAGFRMWQIFAILAPVVVLFMMVMIYVAPDLERSHLSSD